MRVTMLASGTRGDVQPLVALGVGLRQAGHDVQVATHAEFESLVKAHGLDFFLIAGSPSQMMQDAGITKSLETGENKNTIAFVRQALKVVEKYFEQGMADTLAAFQNTDVALFSMFGFYFGYHVAEKLNLPFMEAVVLPSRPTGAFPSPILGTEFRLGSTANRLSHTVVLRMGWAVFQLLANRARKWLDLPPLSLSKLFADFEEKRQPVLNGFSPSVQPKPPDWAAWHHVTGYWFLDRPVGWEPPAGLVDFLDSGPPPVYIGFGSMTSRDPQEATATVLDALRKSGQRGVISTGWAGIGAADLPHSVYKLDSVPHEWLFPRMAAVVHHGGAGTTAAGLRAGVPSILVPFMGDQYFWGRRVRDLGVGPGAIMHRRLTADRLAYAIRVAVEHEPIRLRAAVLGEKIRAEDGVGNAVQVIESAVKKKS